MSPASTDVPFECPPGVHNISTFHRRMICQDAKTIGPGFLTLFFSIVSWTWNWYNIWCLFVLFCSFHVLGLGSGLQWYTPCCTRTHLLFPSLLPLNLSLLYPLCLSQCWVHCRCSTYFIKWISGQISLFQWIFFFKLRQLIFSPGDSTHSLHPCPPHSLPAASR